MDAVLIVTDGTTIGLMPIVILLLLAVVVVAHTALLVSTQLMMSPFTSVLSVYVVAPVPTGLPFLRHWYAGLLPPLVGTAVNTTVELLHTGLLGVVINNEGVTDWVTFIVMALLATVAVVIHAALLVIWQVTTSPFSKLDTVYVGLLVPTVVVPRFHTYTGVVPPLVGVAVKVTDVPEQIAVADAAILTEGVIIGLTVSKALLLVADGVHVPLTTQR